MFTDPEELRDRHAGRPAWILGAGPSILRQDPREVQGVVFAVNRSIELVSRAFPTPTYWLFTDLGFPALNSHMFASPGLCKYPEPVKLCGHIPGAFLLGRGFTPGGDGRDNRYLTFEFGDNPHPHKLDTVLSAGRSTVAAALHAAFIFGCNPIHILGLDFKADEWGRLHWYDPIGGEPHAPYCKHQEGHIHALVTRFKSLGTTITVKSASWLETKEYLYPWERYTDRHVKTCEELMVKEPKT